MEKDIYVPKFIDNSDEIKKGNVKGEDRYKYVGSKTTFKPIYKVKPHQLNNGRLNYTYYLYII